MGGLLTVLETELRQQAKTGRLIKEFVASEVWTTVLLPQIETWENANKEAALESCKDGRMSAEQVAMSVSFLSGKNTMLNTLLVEMNIWIEQGQVAAKKLGDVKEDKK